MKSGDTAHSYLYFIIFLMLKVGVDVPNEDQGWDFLRRRVTELNLSDIAIRDVVFKIHVGLMTAAAEVSLKM